MRHRKDGRQLGRNTSHRKALFRSLLTALFDHERIETTSAKAKELKVLADRMVTLGKLGTLAARRKALTRVWRKDVVAKLFKDIAPRFVSRSGGYTRIIKTRRRVGDGAEMVAIELVSQAESTPKEEQKSL